MTPYVGELRLFAGNFAPDGWALCAGQVLAISQYEPLYQLIGTSYGGNGTSNFQLPDLRGRTVCHAGGGLVQAQTGGQERVTLTTQQLPSHTHSLQGTQNQGTTAAPLGRVLAAVPSGTPVYGTRPPLLALDPSSISATGGSEPHENRQPYVCISWIISLYGIYPTPT